MSEGAQIDYEALAKQAGAIGSESASAGRGVDYAALAKQAGATSSKAADQPEKAGFGKRFLQSSGFEGMVEAGKNPPQTFGDVVSRGLAPAKELVGKVFAPAQHLQEIIAAHKAGNKEGTVSGVSKLVDSFIPGTGNANELSQNTMKDVQDKNYAALGGTATGLATQLALTRGAVKGPAALKESAVGAYRGIGNPFGLASTGEELLTQGISPRASATSFKPSLAKAAPDLKAYHAESPIKNVQDLNDAIPEIKQRIWDNEVDPALKRQAAKPLNMSPVSDAVRKQITPELREFDSANADKLDTLAAKLSNARNVAQGNSLLKYINGQLESYFSKYPAARRANLMANPETAGWEAARSELRNQFLGTLEQAGETGVRDARLRYGALMDIGDEVERRVNVADRAKPMSLGRILGLVGAVPTGGLSVAAGELSTYLNKPDVLVRRGLSRLGRGAAPQAPQLLGRGTGSQLLGRKSLFSVNEPE